MGQPALVLSKHLGRTELMVRILVGELVGVQTTIAGVALQAAGEAARADLEPSGAGPPGGVNPFAIKT